jgi:DNA repair exonuclease SbcCD ATPase subunit
MVLINDLFQEAIQRCGELSSEMDKAEAALDGVLSRADDLGATVSSKSEEAHRHLGELTGRLAEAEQELESDPPQAHARLLALAGRAGEVQARVIERLEQVQAGMAELAARRAELETLLETQTEATGVNLDALGQRIHELEEAIAAGLDQSNAALQSFSGALNDAREDWQDRLDDFHDELDRLHDTAVEQAQSYVAGVESTFNEGIDVLVDELANDMLIEPHNQAIDGFMRKFTEEAKAQVAEALAPVRQAMEALGEVSHDEQEALGQNAAEVLKRVEAVLERMERMRPGLALAGRLG